MTNLFKIALGIFGTAVITGVGTGLAVRHINKKNNEMVLQVLKQQIGIQGYLNESNENSDEK